jgi:hypothetical protein
MEGRETLSLLDLLFTRDRSIAVPDETMAKWSGRTLGLLSDALERGWMRERSSRSGVTYTVTRLGSRSLGTYHELLRDEARNVCTGAD